MTALPVYAKITAGDLMMFQDNLRAVYCNSFECRSPKPTDIALVFHGLSFEATRIGDRFSLPQMCELTDAVSALPCRYAFRLGETAYFILDAEGIEADASRLLSDTEYRNMQPADNVFAVAVGRRLLGFYRAHRFCGCCGSAMEDSKDERAMVCPQCGTVVYPEIAPAVIVAITDGDRLLLTKYAGREFKRYALVAGFNEIGESIEDTVRREVMEEVGLRVKNLRFYKSQPWVFSGSLLMGFFCDLDGDNTVTLQEDELSEAEWFDRKDLPDDHSGISLTGEMIEVFRKRGEPKM